VQRQENSKGSPFIDFYNEHEEEEGPEGDDFSQDPNDGAGATRWWDTHVNVDVNPACGHGGWQWTTVGSQGDWGDCGDGHDRIEGGMGLMAKGGVEGGGLTAALGWADWI
jgi:hypothetical protein